MICQTLHGIPPRLAASAGNRFKPWIKTIPYRRKWQPTPWRRELQPTPVFLPGNPWTEEPAGLQSLGSQSQT